MRGFKIFLYKLSNAGCNCFVTKSAICLNVLLRKNFASAKSPKALKPARIPPFAALFKLLKAVASFPIWFLNILPNAPNRASCAFLVSLFVSFIL